MLGGESGVAQEAIYGFDAMPHGSIRGAAQRQLSEYKRSSIQGGVAQINQSLPARDMLATQS
ncbi:MAG: hypothetical protein NTV11_09760 [Rhodocyclales bacterium]|nr:hypothetical protein [Rhodocyclales bacterium]